MSQVVVIHYGFDFTLLTNSIECFFFVIKRLNYQCKYFLDSYIGVKKPPDIRFSILHTKRKYLITLSCFNFEQNCLVFFEEKSASREPSRMKVMKFIYGDLTPAKVSDLKQACKQEVGF